MPTTDLRKTEVECHEVTREMCFGMGTRIPKTTSGFMTVFFCKLRMFVISASQSRNDGQCIMS